MAEPRKQQIKRSTVKMIFESGWEDGSVGQTTVPSGILLTFFMEKFANMKINHVPLNAAVHYGYVDVVEMLLEMGADPNKEERGGINSAFILAQKVNRKGAKERDEKILKMLLDHGVDLDNYEIGDKAITAKRMLRHSKLSHLIEEE